MDRQTEVDVYKAYLATGDPSFLPHNFEKAAAEYHGSEVAAWKARLSGHGDAARVVSWAQW